MSFKIKSKDKQKYRLLYEWIINHYGRPWNGMEAYLCSIDPIWKDHHAIIIDDDLDEAYKEMFFIEMSNKFGWDNPSLGTKGKKKHGVIWWLLIGWWWSILKIFWKICSMSVN